MTMATTTIRIDIATLPDHLDRSRPNVVAEVIDEEGRWLVELAAERHGAPRHPRPRPSCSPPNDGRTDMASGQPST